MNLSMLKRFNNKEIADRQVDTLVGLASGLVADGKIDRSEADALQKWLVANAAASSNPIVHNLLVRVTEMLADGVLDEEESAELLDVLVKFSGSDYEIGEVPKATTLPLCSPEPSIIVQGNRFCFTGTFAFGNRKACEAMITERGGSVGSIAKSTSYLVIGTYVTDSWIHESFGRKIEKAVSWKQEGMPLKIVSEEAWVKQLGL